MGCTGVNGLKVPEFLHVLFNLVTKYSLVFFWLVYTSILEKKQGQNIKECTINATRQNKRLLFFAFVALLLTGECFATN